MLGHRRVSDAIEMAATEVTDETKIGDQYTPHMFVLECWGFDEAGPCREVVKGEGWISLEGVCCLGFGVVGGLVVEGLLVGGSWGLWVCLTIIVVF